MSSLPESLRELIGAGRALEAAADAAELVDNLLDLHAVDDGADTLEVAVAAALKLYIPHHSVLDIKGYRARAGAFGSVSIFHKISMHVVKTLA